MEFKSINKSNEYGGDVKEVTIKLRKEKVKNTETASEYVNSSFTLDHVDNASLTNNEEDHTYAVLGETPSSHSIQTSKKSVCERFQKQLVCIVLANQVILLVAVVVVAVIVSMSKSKAPPIQEVDGGWSVWESWSGCSASCGTGMESRNRTCSNPNPTNGGEHCYGDSTEYQLCNKIACPELDVSWNDWESWGQCSVTCGYGLERRNRTCSDQTGGKSCHGDSKEYRICHYWLCQDQSNQKVDGEWSVWGTWSECSASCNTGMAFRNRSCSSPKPSNGGDYCFGESAEYRLCNKVACPDQPDQVVDGGWSAWGQWSECSALCGSGMESRNRSCSNPKPSNGGDHCYGDSSEYRLCNKLTCPDVHVGFTVYNGDSSSGRNTPLKFLSTLYNSDASFNTSSGVFTCIHPGVYFFSATVMRTKTYGSYYCYFMVNNISSIGVFANDNSNSNSYPGSSASIVLRLNKNDIVNLGSCGDGSFLHFPRALRGPNSFNAYFLRVKTRGLPARTLLFSAD